MNKGAWILLCVYLLLVSCRKQPAERRTEMNGTVTHFGKGYPEQNVKVIAAKFYRVHDGFFERQASKIIDSAVTEANGNFRMQLTMDINDIDSIVVSCYGVTLSTTALAVPGKINNNLNLSVTSRLPVIAYDLHVSNNDNPPLIVSFSPVDSVVITAATLDTGIYYVNASILVSSLSRNLWVNPFFNAWYYKFGVKRSASYSDIHLLYEDTIHLTKLIDASTFLP